MEESYRSLIHSSAMISLIWDDASSDSNASITDSEMSSLFFMNVSNIS